MTNRHVKELQHYGTVARLPIAPFDKHCNEQSQRVDTIAERGWRSMPWQEDLPMRNFVRPLLRRLVVFAAFALLLALPAASAAQTQYLRLEGRVQWVAGNVLTLAVSDGPSVGIDLVRVPQSDYGGLVQGDWVIVRGRLSDDYRRVLGTSIQRGYPSGVQAP